MILYDIIGLVESDTSKLIVWTHLTPRPQNGRPPAALRNEPRLVHCKGDGGLWAADPPGAGVTVGKCWAAGSEVLQSTWVSNSGNAFFWHRWNRSSTSEWLGSMDWSPRSRWQSLNPRLPARSWLVGTPRSSGYHHARPLDVPKKDSIYITMVYQTC